MKKEELEAIKQQIREEVREEMLNILEENKKSNVWQMYMKQEIRPILEEKLGAKKETWNMITALNTIARTYTKRSQVSRINEEDLKKVKPLITWIVSEF